jgi:hypothetical protein
MSMMNEVPLTQIAPEEQRAPARTTETLRTQVRPRTDALVQPVPPRWKQGITILVPAYIGSTFFGLALFALFPDWPFPIINIVMNIFLVLMLTYGAQPLAQRLLAGWLYAPSTSSKKRNRWQRIVMEVCLVFALVSRRLTVRKGGHPCKH